MPTPARRPGKVGRPAKNWNVKNPWGGKGKPENRAQKEAELLDAERQRREHPVALPAQRDQRPRYLSQESSQESCESDTEDDDVRVSVNVARSNTLAATSHRQQPHILTAHPGSAPTVSLGRNSLVIGGTVINLRSLGN